jgi:hypothetical protein
MTGPDNRDDWVRLTGYNTVLHTETETPGHESKVTDNQKTGEHRPAETAHQARLGPGFQIDV